MMKFDRILSAFVFAAVLSGCVKEQLAGEAEIVKRPLDPNVIQSSLCQSSLDMGVVSSADSISITLCVEASSEATKTALAKAGRESKYVCQVTPTGHRPGSNAISSSSEAATKSIYGQNSTNVIPCNFIRIDENYDSDHTALYTFPSFEEGLVLRGEVTGASENTSGSNLRAINLIPEQSYNFYTQPYSSTLNDSIFYHTRLFGWHPAICSLPENGKPVKFSDIRYTNVRAIVGNRIGVVFDHALDGGTDLLTSNFGQAQRWHSNSAPASGARDNRYRDLAKHIFDSNYCTPFGYNVDEEPHYSNAMSFRHYLSAVRIWAKVAQDSTSTLNLSTWGKIISLSFVDQPSTCTVLFPENIGPDTHGTILPNSWSDYTNFTAQTGLIYGEGDIAVPIEDEQVTYPIDMTQSQAEMAKKYLGYCMVQPGQDIIIAIQTAAGTYQATLPHRILDQHTSDSVDIFRGGMIYDVVLNLETKGSVAEFIENEDTGTYIDLSPWDPSPDKQEFKTANCYIVDVNEVDQMLQNNGSEDIPGYCFLGTVLGNGESGIMQKGTASFHTNTATISTPASAKLVWQSEKGLVSNVHLQHGYIRFNVPQARKGNAVIAALDNDGKIVWSWHIWITDKPDVVTTSQNYNYMDRNLGAITTTDGVVVPANAEQAIKLYGLYYQWGRKDPLPGPLKYNQTGGQSMRITPVYNTYGEQITSLGNYIFNQGETIENSIEKPMHYILNPSSSYYNYNWMSNKIDFLWGEEVQSVGGSSYYQKSIYDPCPYGYHVPAEEIQYLAETSDTLTTTHTYGISFDGVYLPYAGYYGPDRNQTSNDGAAYYCGEKGDYQSSVICSDEDGVNYSYFRNHRLRTYISRDTSWTERNIDGQSVYKYRAPNHYVTTTVVKTHHDYSNRCTAASVRCIKETNYPLNVVVRMNPNTRAIKRNQDVPVTFTLEGRTNKGAIKSAKLVIRYTDATSGSNVTWKTVDLSKESTAILTSKTLTGTCTVTVPASITSAAREAELFAKLEMVVKQGTEESSHSSVEYMLKDGFVLTIKMDTQGSGELKDLIDAYCLDVNDSIKVKLPSGTEETRGFATTRLVKHGNLFAPVIGQPTTLTVYVNAIAATVTINGQTAKVDGNNGKTIGEDTFYPYSVTKQKWTTKGTQKIAVTATMAGYGTSQETLDVPVYGINVNTSSKIDGHTTNRQAVTEQNGIQVNWYVFHDQYSNAGYTYFNGLNFSAASAVADYTYIMGFAKTSGNTMIYNACAGKSHPATGSTEGTKLQVANNAESGYEYVLNPFTNGGTYYIHLKTTGSNEYWSKYTAYVIQHDEYQILKGAIVSRYAGRFWFYPVTFSLN